MYAKIFESIYDGSLRKDWKALITFQQLLVLADEAGYVDKTPDAISARTTIPLDIIIHGLDQLSSPDPDSRSKEEEGRRIVLINPDRRWGWRIVNHKEYREIRTQSELRLYWSDAKRKSRDAAASDRMRDLRNRFNAAFKRGETDRWTYLEESGLAEVSRRENCIGEFQELMAYRTKKGKYFPHSIEHLLGAWTSTLDASRNGHSFTESPTVQLKAIEQEIANHVANPECIAYNRNCDAAKKADFKMLIRKQEILRGAIARA